MEKMFLAVWIPLLTIVTNAISVVDFNNGVTISPLIGNCYFRLVKP